MQHKKIYIITGILLSIILLIFYCFNVSRNTKDHQSTVSIGPNIGKKLAVVVVLDQINIEDLEGDYPHIHQLMEKGAVALMNVRTVGRYEPASGYLTIGSGTRAYAPGAGGVVLGFNEKYQGQEAGKAFENFTGVKASASNILVLDIPRLTAENKKQDHEIIPGLLGARLKEQGVSVTLLGNCDTLKEKSRLAGLIAMDSQGIVDRGDVSQDLLIKDADSPFFVKTDYEKLYQRFQEYKDSGGLMVLHLGDTVRADNYSDYVFPEKYDYYKKRALRDADQFIGRIAGCLNFSQDLLMVVTPFPSFTGYKKKNLLTPFIMVGPGITSGYAISPTTRWQGIIANIDVAPTILSFYSLPVPPVMLGHAVQGQCAENVFKKLVEVNGQTVSTYVQRAYLIKPFVALQIFISLGFLILIFFRKEWLSYIRPLILASISVPVAFLVLPKVASNELWSKYLWLIILTILLVIIAISFQNTLRSIIFISLITAVAILLDLVWGAPLLKTSALSYDPISGSRYYGLGNEYMGVLIGSLIIGVVALGYAAIPAFVIAFYLILSPSYGSNVGGTISAFAAFLTTLLLKYNLKLRMKHILVLGVGIAIALVILFFVVGPHNPPSHISQTIEVVKAGGMKSIFSIIGRKLSMNYKLLKYTVWTRALLTSIGVIVALLYRPPYILKRIFQKNHNLYKGFIGAGVGCFLALVFNDSGIVAAATMMIYIALPVMLLVIDEIKLS